MSRDIANLVRWEFFKLQRRRMLWVLFAFALLFAQIAAVGSYFSYQSLKASGGEVTIPVTVAQQQEQQGSPRTVACNDLLSGDEARTPKVLAPQILEGLRTTCTQQAGLLPARLEKAYQDLTLPGSITSALLIFQSLGLILIAILAASAIGIDYGAGTLRSVLSQGVGRWRYLMAKIVTLAALAALSLILSSASVAATSLIATALAGPPAAGTAAATWSDAGVALWKAWSSLIPYLALTTAVTVLGRSTAAGMAIGLGYYVGEQIITSLLSGFISWFASVANYLLVHNISAWSGGGLGTTVAVTTDATRAGIVLVLYTMGFFALAFRLYERRDVHGATGGG